MGLGITRGIIKFGAVLTAAGLIGCLAPTGSAGSGSESALTAGQKANNANNGVGKISVCHTPPGNPANWHTISIGDPAYQAHLDHGDPPGACGEGGGNNTGTNTNTGTNNPEMSTGTN